jgi:hypothetical protein
MNQRNYKAFSVRFFCALLIFSIEWFQVSAQPKGSIEGIVIDAKTRSPIPFATIFLANSSYGVESSANGTFQLEKIAPGKYDIVVSLVGYEKLSHAVEVSANKVMLHLELIPQITELREVVVEVGDWKKHYRTFEKYFLGQTPHANQCTIKNPDDIYLSYDKKTKVLKAEADKPIVVENVALGYRIYYLLSQFEFDEKALMIRVFGIPRFDNLVSKSERQTRHWLNERDAAYLGSLKHFMQCMLKRELRKNKFLIYRDGTDTELQDSSLFPDSVSHQLHFKGMMKIIYEGESEDFAYRQARYRRPQISTIEFLNETLTLYDNGYYDNPNGVILHGYLAWAETLGDLIPFGYELKKKR